MKTLALVETETRRKVTMKYTHRNRNKVEGAEVRTRKIMKYADEKDRRMINEKLHETCIKQIINYHQQKKLCCIVMQLPFRFPFQNWRPNHLSL